MFRTWGCTGGSPDSVGPAVHPPADTTASPDKRRRVAQLGQDVRNYTVVDARMPQTMTNKGNTKYVGRLFATASNKASHMVDADLTVSKLEDLITPALPASLLQGSHK